MSNMQTFIKSLIQRTLSAKTQTSLWRTYNRIKNRGQRYACPLCGAQLKTLWPRGLAHPVLAQYDIIGGGFREHASCPVCGSTERERLVWLYISQRTDILARPARLLHVAPERELGARLRAQPQLAYLSADLMDEGVMVKMDITDIHYPDASFDAIICNHVLEHVPDDTRALREFYRVLAPGGWAILQVPYSQQITVSVEDPSIVTAEARAQVFGQEDHVRIYAKQDYLQRLEFARFSVECFDWLQAGPDFGGPDNHFGLMPRETLFIVRK